jgi:F-type H+-transporting ATPase subunit epsilon
VRLRVLAPTEVVVDRDVDAVVAEALDGSFCLLPHHLDLVAPLAPSLLAYRVAGTETFLALAGGTLVKCGDEVLVSSPRVVRGPALDDLQTTIETSFRTLADRERAALAALARLETDLIRRFVELETHG